MGACHFKERKRRPSIPDPTVQRYVSSKAELRPSVTKSMIVGSDSISNQSRPSLRHHSLTNLGSHKQRGNSLPEMIPYSRRGNEIRLINQPYFLSNEELHAAAQILRKFENKQEMSKVSSRILAERLLLKKQPGTYLARSSSIKASDTEFYAFSIVLLDGSIHHVLIQMSQQLRFKLVGKESSPEEEDPVKLLQLVGFPMIEPLIVGRLMKSDNIKALKSSSFAKDGDKQHARPQESKTAVPIQEG